MNYSFCVSELKTGILYSAQKTEFILEVLVHGQTFYVHVKYHLHIRIHLLFGHLKGVLLIILNLPLYTKK